MLTRIPRRLKDWSFVMFLFTQDNNGLLAIPIEKIRGVKSLTIAPLVIPERTVEFNDRPKPPQPVYTQLLLDLFDGNQFDLSDWPGCVAAQIDGMIYMRDGVLFAASDDWTSVASASVELPDFVEREPAAV